MRYKFFFICLLVTLIIKACVYSYDPNISKYENILVVDGEITNLPGPYQVKLSRSYTYHRNKSDPVSGALIKIVDNSGQEIELTEVSDGTYSTADNAFQGVVGHSYKVHIVLDGVVYESGFQEIKAPVPVDRIYWEYKNEKNRKGIEIFVDAHDSNNNTHFYGWDYEETWKFQVPYSNHDEYPDWETCFKYDESVKFNILSTANLNNDLVQRHPIEFIGDGTNRLILRYSMLVKQYSLNEQSYKFFKDVSTQNYSQGTLFDPIPGSLNGNIKNLSNPDIPVLGYFLVCGAVEKRLFVDRKELPIGFHPISGFDCNEYHVQLEDTFPNNDFRLDFTVDSLIRERYQIYYQEHTFMTTEDGGSVDIVLLKLAKPHCFNCTLSGSNEVPDFWIEE